MDRLALVKVQLLRPKYCSGGVTVTRFSHKEESRVQLPPLRPKFLKMFYETKLVYCMAHRLS